MDPPMSEEKALLVLCEHAISHPDDTWPQVRDACIRIGMEVHADRLALPLWSVQELMLGSYLYQRYLLEFRIHKLDRIHHQWQTNWLELLLEAAVTYRTSIRWYGRDMDRALTYERWLLHGCVGVVAVCRPDWQSHQLVLAEAARLSIPTFRIDPDSCQVFRSKSSTKEK